ncbi:uncharacterized protein PpBr36_11186 [Pyricularia pennisetigena]|uniref:uncharacterized protein n=1 Tax=Pyricularia pennisetigena TaxID=1578925 RepID=UPI0011544485|nr:uncharacterized protein PpBr36_11186 [Pyricularia pennisetigena]TLS20412.1 hypothetical protein PpBr36_11186 [Pyricularia pennisetigena]
MKSDINISGEGHQQPSGARTNVSRGGIVTRIRPRGFVCGTSVMEERYISGSCESAISRIHFPLELLGLALPKYVMLPNKSDGYTGFDKLSCSVRATRM